MVFHPRDLPRRRNLTLKRLNDPANPLRAQTGKENQSGLDALARHLRAAELYWVSAPMAALGMSAGAQLDELDANPETRPAGCGLIAFDGGIGNLPLPGGWAGIGPDRRPLHVPLDHLPVSVLSWGPYEGEVLVWAFTDRREMRDALASHGAELVEDSLPPLIPTLAAGLPIQPVRPDDASLGRLQPAARALVASWLLMQQPTLADRTTTRPKKSERGETLRLGLPDPEVSVVDLRRQYVPDDREETGETGGRRYRHRWVVSGHWRDQAHGPHRSLRRKTWIAAHVKGPDGAPLLATERVNMWRR